MTRQVNRTPEESRASSVGDQRSAAQSVRSEKKRPAGVVAGVRVRRHWPAYPCFDAEFVAGLVARLDVSAELQELLTGTRRRYVRDRWLFVAIEILFAAAYPILALGIMVVDALLLQTNPAPVIQGLIIFAGLVTILFLGPTIFFRIIWWDRSTAVQRAVRASGLLLRHVRFDEHRVGRAKPGGWVHTRLGVMAKSAFTIVRGGSFTWTVPPAVSDRASRLASPLLDIALPDNIDLPTSKAYRQALAEFTADAAYILIAHRPDLLPRLRQHYSHRLHPRDADLADHDTRYLDPLRGRTPWDMAKEHAVPLLALLISLIALLRK